MIETVKRQALVPNELAGARLDRAAAELWPEFSRSRLQQWIESGALRVDGGAARPKQRLRGGESLVIAAELDAVIDAEPEPIPLAIVHEDEHLIVIDKPAGLVVHPGAGNPRSTLLNALLHHDPTLEQVPRAGLVHRLDKDTSGLLVVARDISTHHRLVAMLESRLVKRIYRAVCQTAMTGGGLIDAPLDRSPRDRKRMAVRQGGREARTRYRLMERFRAHSHIEVELETGRTHQIRVHMAHIRAPLVGDPAYGGRPRLPPRPTEALRGVLQGFPRQALHAHALRFEHPASGEALAFESPLPADIERLLAALREDCEAGGS